MAITRTDRNQVFDTNGNLIAEEVVEVDVTVEVNTAALTDRQVIEQKMAGLKAFLSDVDVQASLDRPNNQAPTAQELNRTLKALIRQARQSANFDLRLARYVFGQLHPELLDDITDV